MNTSRKVMVLTGKRGGFGAMKPMLRLLRDDPAFQLQLVATDQHLSDRFGRTIKEIEAEFSVVARVDMRQADDRPESRAHALGVCLQEMAETLNRLRPDICVLYGDRGEVLATALAATTLNLPIAHIQGGDISGSQDEVMRHAVTKLAHVHFPSTDNGAERIRRMGEEAWRIHVVGDNHLDLIVAREYADPDAVARELLLEPGKPILVVLQHSLSTAPAAAYSQMVQTLEAVRDTGNQVVVIYPCSDVGYDGVVRAIKEIAKPPQFRVHVNLEAPMFWGLLAIASVLIGNSSAGLIETPSFCLPAINIGQRQQGRAHSQNVIHSDHDARAIRAAIDGAISEEFRRVAKSCAQPFGDGKAGLRIVKVLREISLDCRLLQKRMTY